MPGRLRVIRSPPESPPIGPAAVPADPAPVIAISDDEAAPAPALRPSQSAADAHPSAPAHSALLQNLSDSESDGSSWADELEEAEAEQQQTSAVPPQIPPNFSRNLPRAVRIARTRKETRVH